MSIRQSVMTKRQNRNFRGQTDVDSFDEHFKDKGAWSLIHSLDWYDNIVREVCERGLRHTQAINKVSQN